MVAVFVTNKAPPPLDSFAAQRSDWAGYSDGGGAPFSSMEAAQWYLGHKKLNFQGIKFTQLFCIVGPTGQARYRLLQAIIS